MATGNDSHIKGIASLPKYGEVVKGPMPMRHRNRLGIKDLQSNPQGAGKPSVTPTVSNGGRKGY
jgi:hypothetical protein